MIIKNEDVRELISEVPEGHSHIRTTIVLKDSEIVLQEATTANLVRAYIRVKTHPSVKSIRLRGRKIGTRKKGYAEWQLVEEE